jgi:hypothetical protein
MSKRAKETFGEYQMVMLSNMSYCQEPEIMITAFANR